MSTLTYPLSGLHCNSCVRKVTQALAPFAQEVQVSLDPMQVRLLGDPMPSAVPFAGHSLEALQAALTQVGSYRISAPQNSQNRPKTATAAENIAQFAINLGVSTSPPTTEAQPTWLSTYRPLLLILAFILGSSVLVQVGQHAGHGMGALGTLAAVSAHDTMRYFMAGFFLVFAFFKLLDLQAFATAYAGYDLLAARWRTWGLIYPFAELLLGMAYLANVAPTATAWLTIGIMGFSALGVIRAVLGKQQIRCACLGAVFNLPMSTVTIVEDVGMVLMAVWMLMN